jgi:hypothetical protein
MRGEAFNGFGRAVTGQTAAPAVPNRRLVDALTAVLTGQNPSWQDRYYLSLPGVFVP